MTCVIFLALLIDSTPYFAQCLTNLFVLFFFFFFNQAGKCLWVYMNRGNILSDLGIWFNYQKFVRNNSRYVLKVGPNHQSFSFVLFFLKS